MKHYELFYVVSGALPENRIEPLQTEMGGLIAAAGGTVTRQETWGRKKLAYPIKKERNGFYNLLEFDGEAASLAPVQQKMKLHKDILRFLLVENAPLSERDLMAQEEAQKRAQVRRTKVMAERAAEEAPRPKAEPKISLEELDKKLDELLDQDIV